ncbi:hypothetical protein PF007_g20440 [Phytophthora fragariae]|uniref:Uncharacterized protein n=1 Tax=Phytophthora fragariae TaxID=53985 RepID=A0A6A3R542_9STRA|nr:hypothetical protein PF011_g29225 [Phytophthora fragariae]KAE9087275.1 hypothetical protein PF007_g20440 [Phytophthora fragariae]
MCSSVAHDVERADGEPSELLRSNSVTQTGTFAEYHRKLVTHLARATEAAHAALAKDQLCRQLHYNHRVRQDAHFEAGDLVWVLKPPKGKGITKLAHQWVGPAKIVQSAGFDNWEVVRDDTDEHSIVYCSFLVSSHGLSDSLGLIAERIIAELELEAENGTPPENDGGVDEQGATQHEDTRTAPLTNRGDAVEDAPVTRSRGEGQMVVQKPGGATRRREAAEVTGRRATDGATSARREPAPTSATQI